MTDNDKCCDCGRNDYALVDGLCCNCFYARGYKLTDPPREQVDWKNADFLMTQRRIGE